MMEINIVQAKKAVSDIIIAKLVPNLLGSPGIGKSDIIREVADKYNLKVIDFRLAQADPTDMMGFPTMNEDRSRCYYAPPMTFPLETDPLPDGYAGWLLFFDEMPSAPMSVQAAVYKIILDRMVGEHKLHKNVAMVCAGNLLTDKAIVNRLSTAMQSRLVHLNLVIDHEAWIDWAIMNKIDHRILAYIRFKPDILHDFKPDHADNTFPCPRTWHFLSKLIKTIPVLMQENLALMAGTIGEGAAVEFLAFSEIYKTLPTWNEILNTPNSVPIPDEPSTLFAISSLISNKADRKNISQLMILVNRLPVEFQVIALQGIVRVDEDILDEPSVKIWVAANANELL